MAFKIIEPVTISSGDLVSCTIDEDDAPAYNAGTTYAQGDDVIYSHRVWRSTDDDNTGHTPSDSSVWWSDQGATIRWRAFDNEQYRRVIDTSDITYVISPPDSITAVGICYANTGSVTVSTADGYSRTIVSGELRSTFIFDDIPSTTSNVTITLTRLFGYARVGEIVLGTVHELGNCQRVRCELVESDEDFVDYLQRFTYSIVLDRSETETVRNRLFDLQSTYAVFSGAPGNPEFGTNIFAKMSDHDFMATPNSVVFATVEVDSAP